MNRQTVGYIKYTTVQGDTFDIIARFHAYGEEKMASYIIKANPDYSDVIIFDAGIMLRIPVLNNADSPESLPPWRRS